MNHTATPWKVVGRSIKVASTSANSERYTICEAPKWSRAALGTHGYDKAIEEDKANMAFIALACNAHDDLVKALRAYMDLSHDDFTGRRAAFRAAKDALAKAEGQS